MTVERINSILNNDIKSNVFYNNRLVWIQEINNNLAKIGLVDTFEEMNVSISSLYE